MDKESLRKARKEAYQKAKAMRDADPKYQAIKEKAKADRRAQYKEFKEQQKQKKILDKQKRSAERDKELLVMVMKGKEWEEKHEQYFEH